MAAVPIPDATEEELVPLTKQIAMGPENLYW